MKLDVYFPCPHCGERMLVVGEADEGESSWDLDIRAVEGFEAEEPGLEVDEEETEEESGVEESVSEKPEESEEEIEEQEVVGEGPEGEGDAHRAPENETMKRDY